MLTPKWRCDECGELHDSEEYAAECCPPSISQVYVCPVCGEYDSMSIAMICCGGQEESLPVVTAAELEAAGQYALAF